MMDATETLGKIVPVTQACEALAVSRASLYRRRSAVCVKTTAATCDKRKSNRSHRALSPQQRTAVLDALHSEPFMDQSPREVYATLLDEGTYLCSVRTMYRILSENGPVKERRNQRKHPQYTKPELLATGPNQVWSWDITKLLGPEKWTYYYLYVILDIYSRHTVGWMLAHRESSDLASRLIRETIEKQGVSEDQLTIHSDRGPSMTSHSVAQLLASLSVTKSHSRPHVSNDNPFSESQFKTLKYRPEFPSRFGSYEDALSFCRRFFKWYDDENYHTGIGLLTPSVLHYGHAEEVLAARHKTMQAAYQRHPERFVSGSPKRQQVPPAVWINPPARLPGDDKKRPPKTHCSQRPDAPLTHPRPGYPSPSCVPAELASVSPGNVRPNQEPIASQPTLNTRAMPKKIPGCGAEPHENNHDQPFEH
jgi:putative transposase